MNQTTITEENPLQYGEQIKIERRFLPTLEERDAAEKTDIADLQTTLFHRLETRRRVEEARLGQPLHIEHLVFSQRIDATGLAVEIAAQICCEDAGDGFLNESNTFQTYESLRRL